MIWHNGNQLVSQPRDLGLVLAQRVEKNPDDPLVGRLIADRDLIVDGVATRLFSLMHDGRWLLVNGNDETIERGGAWAARVRIVTAIGAQSMLIRPDGCIAWAGRPGGLRSALERWFPGT